MRNDNRLIRAAVGGGDAAGGAGVIRVNVATDSGLAGSGTTACTFTYTVTSLSGGTLGTTVTPAMQRPAIGKTVPGVIGMGHNAGGSFVLDWVDEVPYKAKRVCA